jgi:hypothetical protein
VNEALRYCETAWALGPGRCQYQARRLTQWAAGGAIIMAKISGIIIGQNETVTVYDDAISIGEYPEQFFLHFGDRANMEKFIKDCQTPKCDVEALRAGGELRLSKVS